MSNAFASEGLIIEIGDAASPEVFIQINEIKVSDAPNDKDEFDDVTHLNSGRWREKIPVLKDGGELSLDGNYLPTDPGQMEARAAKASNPPELRNFKITESDNSLDVGNTTAGFWEFTAYVGDFTPHFDFSKAATLSLKLVLSGAVSYTDQT